MGIAIKSVPTSKGEVEIIVITNSIGASVKLTSIGAAVMEITVPDREGTLDDVVIGYHNIEDYHDDGHCAGKIAGRYANRIAHGHLEIEDVVHQLSINNGPNTLHGGPDGFQNQIWESKVCGDDMVGFSLISPDGHESFPGTLQVSVRYQWTDDCVLSITMEAVTDKTTVVNLTNHSYFNLSGHKAKSALHHRLRLKASKWLPTDDTLIPTGEYAPVAGTPMDFTTLRPLGLRIRDEFDALRIGKGYDNCWVVDEYEPGKLQSVAFLDDPESGRGVEFITDQPGVQVYTGNWLGDTPEGKEHTRYADYCAVAIECQDLPDAPHQPQFPSTMLRPGEKYHRNIILKFSARS